MPGEVSAGSASSLRLSWTAGVLTKVSRHRRCFEEDSKDKYSQGQNTIVPIGGSNEIARSFVLASPEATRKTPPILWIQSTFKLSRQGHSPRESRVAGMTLQAPSATHKLCPETITRPWND